MAKAGFAGRYELIHELGKGGMGSVWLARDGKLGRQVAVKSLLAANHPDERKRAMALREARAAARLSHPNIVGIIELLDEDTDGGPWIIMEYVEGRSLAEWITDRSADLTETKIAELGGAVLSALDAMHRVKVIHRDVKPDNILVRRAPGPLQPLTSQVCLVDFGNAAIEDEASTKSVLIGTLGYMAPERFCGPAGPASDLWSLGVTLYSAVEGRLPFRRDSQAEAMHAVMSEAPDDFRRARLLAPVITRLLEKDPDKRAGVSEIAALLRTIVHPPHDHRRRPSPPGGPSCGGTPGGYARGPGDRVRAPGRSGRTPYDVAAQLKDMPTVGFAAFAVSDPAAAAELFYAQGPREAARIIDRMAMDPVAIMLAELLTGDFTADLLQHLAHPTATAILLGLPPARAAQLLTLVPKVPASALLAALPARERATGALLAALSDQVVARLLGEISKDQTIALLSVLGLKRTSAVLARLNPRRSAEVLDVVPTDTRKALALLRSLPEAAVGGVLEQMNPARVAAIVLVNPVAASPLLARMQVRAQRAVLDEMNV